MTDDVIRMCPGKKGCISIRNKDASKEKVQKRRLLANISEIYVNFKAGFWFFYFYSPAAKLMHACWCCWFAQCLCMHLPSKCNTVNTSLNYKDALKLCVCSTGNADRM